MSIPNLIIPGAGKSATSSLHNYLDCHPEICMSSKKEPHYFTIDERFNEGIEFYESLFDDDSDNYAYYGESSTSYFPNKKAIKRIKKSLDGVKIIVILRNPIERTVSHYRWLVQIGKETKTFRKAIVSNFIKGVDYPQNSEGIWRGYFTSSLYGRHIDRLYDVFDQKDVFVVTTEDLAKFPLETLNKCFSFLEIPKLDRIPEIKSNVTKKGMNRRRRNLRDIFRFKGTTKLFLKKGVSIVADELSSRVINRDKLVNSIEKQDKDWLYDKLYGDIKLFETYYPDIVEKWKL